MTIELPNVETLIDTLAERVAMLVEQEQPERCCLVGIHQGGAWLANLLQERLGLAGEPGAVDIAFYRDDLDRAGLQAQVRPTRMPLDIDNQVVILIDDILYTGRTIRAALNEIFDYGRPAAVRLAVLLERPGRELPISADVCGGSIELPPRQRVKLRGPAPLHLVIEEARE
ncbi:bifunctional pyr operon transcriptional regulator/uracil phosphoribosyltransferase PyrR [Spiribacter sp. C176]|uniref:Bifunctional pyr operon transcriptional regulator/uracil phosphoribosyltransferase PyrR n=1 Tax=Spiribacter salilacus TaxID=2664894 RepID=A0A6N7QUK1_9GAMM|nr:bifunctional pyr operon transcriptional regulator/uracil phosphoribosyltransferase PyrR [Spiribacter salilacus]MRH78007.1 bifunctional pyr operon transcriptional regulator/uracil phosphoribosyltransferase PyrR [Spiribacter salilacus]